MSRRRFLAIASILGLVFGLAFLLVPAQLMSFYGMTLDPAGQWIGRFLGAQGSHSGKALLPDYFSLFGNAFSSHLRGDPSTVRVP